jgi:hypothetical protein
MEKILSISTLLAWIPKIYQENISTIGNICFFVYHHVKAHLQVLTLVG